MSGRIPSLAYAKAVFETAQQSDALDAVYGDFQQLVKLLNESKELSAFVRIRSQGQSRAEILDKIFLESFHPLTLKFLKFLVYKNRLEILQPVVQGFIELYREKRGIAAMDVTSYGPLEEAALNEIGQKWNRRLNKSVELDFKTDPSILGGIVFKIKDHVHDYSIKGQLEKLRQQLIK